MNERSARALLGVSSSATVDQIKRAYRRAALAAHPDRGGDPAAFQQLVEAHKLLSSLPLTAPRPWFDAGVDQVASRLVGTRPKPVVDMRRSHRPEAPAARRCFGDVLAEKLTAA